MNPDELGSYTKTFYTIAAIHDIVDRHLFSASRAATARFWADAAARRIVARRWPRLLRKRA
jgi:hypothetical protein